MFYVKARLINNLSLLIECDSTNTLCHFSSSVMVSIQTLFETTYRTNWMLTLLYCKRIFCLHSCYNVRQIVILSTKLPNLRIYLDLLCYQIYKYYLICIKRSGNTAFPYTSAHFHVLWNTNVQLRFDVFMNNFNEWMF